MYKTLVERARVDGLVHSHNITDSFVQSRGTRVPRESASLIPLASEASVWFSRSVAPQDRDSLKPGHVFANRVNSRRHRHAFVCSHAPFIISSTLRTSFTVIAFPTCLSFSSVRLAGAVKQGPPAPVYLLARAIPFLIVPRFSSATER